MARCGYAALCVDHYKDEGIYTFADRNPRRSHHANGAEPLDLGVLGGVVAELGRAGAAAGRLLLIAGYHLGAPTGRAVRKRCTSELSSR